MSNEEIVTQLVQITENPSEVVYSVNMHHILQQVAQRMGSEALSLTKSDMNALRDEIKEALNQMMDYRDAVDEGLEAFKIIHDL